MKIKSYLEKEGITVADLQRLTGIPMATLWRIVNEKQKSLRPSVALAISKATKGEVGLLDLLFPGETFDLQVRSKGDA